MAACEPDLEDLEENPSKRLVGQVAMAEGARGELGGSMAGESTHCSAGSGATRAGVAGPG